MEGTGDIFRDTLGPVDLRHPFGERAKHGAVIHFLKRLTVLHRAADLTDQHHHRGAVLHGGMDADTGMGGTRSTGHHADTRLAGQLAIGLRHIGGTVLDPGNDELDPVTHRIHGIEHAEIGFPRYAEDRIDPLNQQLFNKDGAAGNRIGRRGKHYLTSSMTTICSNS